MITRLLPLLAAVAALTAGCTATTPKRDYKPADVAVEATLILISLDGFRWDYLDWDEAPTLRKLATDGVRAEGLIPVFPSKTFPCHYSLVTGLYPGHHGIVSNNMYRADIGAEFHLSDRAAVEDPRWWGGEPIWVTAEKQGLISAAMFWPGSETEIAGFRPTYWHRYDKKFTFENRVKQVLEWLDLPSDKRPRFITLYFEQPNDISHQFGPEAPETRAAVAEVDGHVRNLILGLQERGLADQVDILVTSDHGMAEVGIDRVIVLDDYVQLEPGELFEQGAYAQIFPHPTREMLIRDALDGAHPELAVYRRAEIPEGFHLRRSPHTSPIIGVPTVGWHVVSRGRFNEYKNWMLKGDHGQDPADPRMHGLFIASGPSFKRGMRIARFENIEIYNLMTTILGLDPAPNDGDPAALTNLLIH